MGCGTAFLGDISHVLGLDRKLGQDKVYPSLST
jgi:hypothetical protein